MKKTLLVLSSILVSLLLASCVGGNRDTDTASDSLAETSVMTDTAHPTGTGEPETEPSPEEPEETTAPAEPSGTTPEETEPPAEPATDTETETETETETDLFGVSFDHERALRYIDGKNQTKVEQTEGEDGRKVLKLTTVGKTVQDAYVQCRYSGYAKVSGGDQVTLEERPYILFRVRNTNCSCATFKIYWMTNLSTSASETHSASTIFDNTSTAWQYIWMDMSAHPNWKGRLNTLRLDYMDGPASGNESLEIAGIYFAETYEEVQGIVSAGKNPFETETDPAIESEVDFWLSRPDPVPEPDNTPLTAEYEDRDLCLWFDHSFTKTPAECTESTGRNTYRMRLSKNEIEDCHLLLASGQGHTGVTVSVSPFCNASGKELRTELLYGYYFPDVDGKTIPDPTPWVREGQTFDLPSGESRLFIIKVFTTPDSEKGLYEATVTVKDADGKEIRKAAVSAYVWDFTLPDETACKTQMDLNWFNIYAEHHCYEGDDSVLYRNYYDFLLENRVCAYTLPYSKDGMFTDSRIDEYLNNPRVVAFNPLGFKVTPTEENVTSAYRYLSQNPAWLMKSRFYIVDEPLDRAALDQVNRFGELLKRCFPDYRMMAPEHVNHALNAEGTEDHFSYVKDAINCWCFKPYFFTTFEEYNYDHRLTYWNSPLLEKNLGKFRDRMQKNQAEGDEVWWYVTRIPENPEISLMMETEAVRYRILFWQQKLYRVDGFLYYLANDWNLKEGNHGLNAKHETGAGFDTYGNGVLVYCGANFDEYGPVGSLRLECVRDGIEDFEYLTMLAERYGREKTDALIRRLTTSLSRYNTDTEHFDDLRTALGNLLEQAEAGKE